MGVKSETIAVMNPPRGRNDLLLYLDFDGVLHHENALWHPRRGVYLKAPQGYVLFQHAGLLEEILAPYPEVKIVLSTSWVRSYGCSKTANRLPPALRKRVIGATFHSQMYEQGFVDMPRGAQVSADVLRRKPRDWLALDDDYKNWPSWCLDKYVRTDEHEGISLPSVADEIRLKLALMCSAQEMEP
jgi:hypothetical protein